MMGHPLKAQGGSILLNFLSVPLECRSGVRFTLNVTNFHNFGHDSWGKFYPVYNQGS